MRTPRKPFGGQGNDFILGTKANEQDMGNEGDDWIEKGTSDGAPGDNFDPLGNDPIIGNDVFIGDGENDKFNAEGGDDIMVGKHRLRRPLHRRLRLRLGRASRTIPLGVHIDISDRFFDQPAGAGSGTQPLARFDIVEGLSGSAIADVLQGDNDDAASPAQRRRHRQRADQHRADRRAAGCCSTPRSVVTRRFYDGGNIILGGDGSDIIEGRGGDDLIDGDKWLNVRISVRTGIDPIPDCRPAQSSATFDSMTDTTLQTNMLNGTWNPGQLQIVREILTSATADFDTAHVLGQHWRTTRSPLSAM